MQKLASTLARALVTTGLLMVAVPTPAAAQSSCTYVVSPTRIELTGAAATGTIQIDTQPGCAWTAAVDVAWIQLTGATSGAGSGGVSYAVSAVPPAEAPLRQSVIMIRWDTPTLGQNALVTQATGPCNALFSPAPGPTSALTFGGAGGGGSAWVLAEPPFSGRWRIVDTPDWITPTFPALGLVGRGDGGTLFVVSPNPSTEPRSGTITTCSNPITVHQAARSTRAGRFVPADFDDDGIADLTVFRPSTGTWHVLRSAAGFNPAASLALSWGLAGDVPVAGDFDGDKKTELAVYRSGGSFGSAAAGNWLLRYSSDAYGPGTPTAYAWTSAPYHASENRPLLADFSGDGKNDFVLYRPSVGRWHILFTSVGTLGGGGTLTDMQWGLPGDIPVPADYDGDGRADLAVWRPASGLWFLRFSSTQYGTVAVHQWGLPGDVPLVSDFDGDSRADLAVYRPSNGMWFVKYSSTQYSDAHAVSYQWGLDGDVPMPNDYDGDGRTDLAVWRPSTGVWFIRDSSIGYLPWAWRAFQWGWFGDVPVGVLR